MKKKSNIIAVDLDDVLFDFIGYFFDWHNQEYGSNISRDDMGPSRKLWEVWGGTREEASERVPVFFKQVDMLNMPPMEGSVEALTVLKDSFSLNVISARDTRAAEISNFWIEKYFPGIFDQVFLGISNPLDKEKSHSKADIASQIGAGVLIDDQLVHTEECRMLNIHVLLFGDSLWNQSERLPENVTRAKDWAEVVEYFK